MSPELISTVLAVLKDWRVLFAAFIFLLAAGILRRVGIVLNKAPKRARSFKLPMPAKKAPAPAKAAAAKEAAGKEEIEDDEDDGGGEKEAPRKKGGAA